MRNPNDSPCSIIQNIFEINQKFHKSVNNESWVICFLFFQFLYHKLTESFFTLSYCIFPRMFFFPSYYSDYWYWYEFCHISRFPFLFLIFFLMLFEIESKKVERYETFFLFIFLVQWFFFHILKRSYNGRHGEDVSSFFSYTFWLEWNFTKLMYHAYITRHSTEKMFMFSLQNWPQEMIKSQSKFVNRTIPLQLPFWW